MLVGWEDDPSNRMLLGYSSQPSMVTRIPVSGSGAASIHAVVSIRDRLGSATEVSLPATTVEQDASTVNNLIDGLMDGSTDDLKNNPVIQSLSSGNPNTVSQILGSVSGTVNGMNSENIDQAVQSNVLLHSTLASI